MVPAEIAHYRLIGKLGEGGMGEVYRATDTKLGREVAVKVLPEKFAQDPDRMTRFAREARVLAALNHPNIAAIYGVEDRALVMELVEGNTIAERIAKGPIPIEEALPIIEQMIDALEYAHDRGIVHRDLKPTNIKLSPEGRVKILDFGLAKAFRGPDADTSNPDASPTLTLAPDATGVILGTAAYMSPEQARGRAVDRRSDIWSFGVVLYEMTTGSRLFAGETVSDTLAAVLREEPAWDAVPVRLRRLVRACLVRDPRRRMRDIGDARLLLEAAVAEPASAAPSAFRRRLPWVVAACACTATLALGALLWRASQPTERPHFWLNIDLGPDAVTGRDLTAVLSPDGKRIVYPVRRRDMTQLAVRDLDAREGSVLPDTLNGINPFFSPDGEWVGFFAAGKLKTTSVHGGAAISLCEVLDGRGGSWGEDGVIVFAGGTDTGLSRILAKGGTVEQITNPEKQGEWTHRWPQVLNGGKAVLFTGNTSAIGFEDARVEVLSLRTGQVKTIWQGGYFGRYLPTGHLVFVHENTLFAMPFDPKRLEATGAPVPVLQGIAPTSVYGGGEFDFSRNGLFAFLSRRDSEDQWPLVWVDDAGKTEPVLKPGHYLFPKLSPDGTKLALTEAQGPGKWDLWLRDLRKQTQLRLTFTGSNRFGVSWAKDGKHIVFESRRGKNWTLEWVGAAGGEQPQTLLDSPNPMLVGPSFTSVGPRLAFPMRAPDTKSDIWTLPLDLTDPNHPKPGKPEPLIQTPAAETNPAISPDGKWIAYASVVLNGDIYVQRFAPGDAAVGGKWQVSTDGGVYPVWSPSRPQLFYCNPVTKRVMVVDYTTDEQSFHSSEPRVWVDKAIWGTGPAFDVSPDGRRLIAAVHTEPEGASKPTVQVTVLVNWFDDLRRRVPASH